MESYSQIRRCGPAGTPNNKSWVRIRVHHVKRSQTRGYLPNDSVYIKSWERPDRRNQKQIGGGRGGWGGGRGRPQQRASAGISNSNAYRNQAGGGSPDQQPPWDGGVWWGPRRAGRTCCVWRGQFLLSSSCHRAETMRAQCCPILRQLNEP